MTTKQKSKAVRVGDWVQVRDLHGEASRRGKIVEVLGDSAHERYRVRWDEQHTSILYPADGVGIIPRGQTRRAREVA